MASQIKKAKKALKKAKGKAKKEAAQSKLDAILIEEEETIARINEMFELRALKESKHIEEK